MHRGLGLLRWGRRAYAARGVRVTHKAAVTRDPLEAMRATCTDGVIGVLDHSLLLSQRGSPTLRGAAVMENLARFSDRPSLYYPGHSKTDQLSYQLG
jgi:hypothetical protein